MPVILWIAAGGALGAVTRYGIGSWMASWAGAGLPWGTFAVNAGGSFLLGASVRAFDALALPGELRVAVTVGFLGAVTTFSTYSYETVVLLQQGQWGRAVLYSLGSLVLGLILVVAGFGSAQLVLGR